MTDLVREMGNLRTPEGDTPWVRLHYVYPYPHVDRVIPLMAEGKILPYLDIPFQHASPKVLKAMKRPANEAKVLERLKNWRALVPDIAIRSSFVVGFPGETEEDFQYLLDWLGEAQLDRVGAFKFEPVQGAAANALPDPVSEDAKQDRYDRIMALSARISAEKLAARVGSTIDVLIDRVDDEEPSHLSGGEGPDRGHFDAPHAAHHHGIGATGRSKADAPEIDGEVHLRDAGGLKPGDIVRVKVEESDEHDLYGVPL
jgi:ribosomal protein S12 methylthiotransferase